MRVHETLFHGETATLRRHAIQILGAAVAAADPHAAVHRALAWDGERLAAGGQIVPVRPSSRVFVVGAGKGAARMAAAAED
ncbi:MAG: DUF4147 domain-containing protein, partial [Armatimonadota bacterium]|nr:DUF4147 domain-containing protein [Armatimonadota bacterium]